MKGVCVGSASTPSYQFLEQSRISIKESLGCNLFVLLILLYDLAVIGEKN